MFSVCVVCEFFCVCVQVEALQRAVQGVLPSVLELVTEVKRKVSRGLPRSELGGGAKGKK
jgi:hypothetical protein